MDRHKQIVGAWMWLRWRAQVPRLLLLVLLVWVSATSAGETIQVVNSWADYRSQLIGEGQSEQAADADIADLMSSLNEMDRTAGDDRLGISAPPFRFDGWLNSEPLTLEDLRGRVLMVRWWTDTCPFCASSAPALRTLDAEYGERGLTVIGVFHPKAGRDDPLDIPRVERAVRSREFSFPIAIDWDWRNRTLKDWWLTGPKRPATSVTFLVDKSGIIRFIHPGMEYHDRNGSPEHAVCADDMGRIRQAIERLLAE